MDLESSSATTREPVKTSSRRLEWRLGIAVLMLLLAACSLPRDPKGTTASVRQGVLRVGVVEGSRLASATEGKGLELRLVRELATEMGADLQVRTGSVDALLEDLESFDLDLMIGGIEESSQLTTHVGVTLPYHEEEVERSGSSTTVAHVFLVPPGENRWLHEVDRFLQERRGAIREDRQ